MVGGVATSTDAGVAGAELVAAAAGEVLLVLAAAAAAAVVLTAATVVDATAAAAVVVVAVGGVGVGGLVDVVPAPVGDGAVTISSLIPRYSSNILRSSPSPFMWSGSAYSSRLNVPSASAKQQQILNKIQDIVLPFIDGRYKLIMQDKENDR